MAYIPPGTGQALHILIGAPNNAPSLDITRKVDRDSISIEETGIRESAYADFELLDKTLAHTAIRGRWNVLITYDGSPLFRGIIGQARPEVRAIYSNINISARDIGVALDRQIIKNYGSGGTSMTRPAGESDRARIAWLFDLAGPKAPHTINVTSKVQTLNASMEQQRFPPNLTLRQALERILGGASDSANYYVDMIPRLHTFDDANGEAGVDAPYDIVVDRTLSGTEIGPADLTVEWDVANYYNGYFVRAATKPLSGFYTDAYPFSLGDGTPAPMPPPYASPIFGDSFTYLDAPDANTRLKVERVVKAALRDTRNPVPRGSFSVEGDLCWNGSNRFTAGQLLYVESPMHGLNGRGSDSGPWAGSRPVQPLRIVRNTISVIDGGNSLRMEIEFGGRRVHLYQAGGDL